MEFWESFLLAFTALLPLINPLGSALVFLGLVGDEPLRLYRRLARKIAIATLGLLVVIEFAGSLLLHFFGISLPIVQVAGGLVIAATGWSLLFEKDANSHASGKHAEMGGAETADGEDLEAKTFYPFTFPVTAGPGTLVVMLTLSARASMSSLLQRATIHAGIILASIALSVSVYLCYGYAPSLVKAVRPPTVHGILRVMAFILMCIGVQIIWNGIFLLAPTLLTGG